jgi:hypothetical protein
MVAGATVRINSDLPYSIGLQYDDRLGMSSGILVELQYYLMHRGTVVHFGVDRAGIMIGVLIQTPA